MSPEQFPVHVDARETAILGQALVLLSREPAFKDVIRLFDSRKAQKQPTEPLEKALYSAFSTMIRRHANL